MVVGSTLYEKKDFKALQKYLINTYEELGLANLFSHYNHQLKLQLLGLIITTIIKNRNYKLCEKYLDILHKEQLKYNSDSFPNILGMSISADLYICTGRYEKARQILEKLQTYESKLNMEDLNYLYMNLTVIHVIEENYSKAIQCIFPLHRSEKLYIKQSGIEGVFKKHMLECIIHFETGDYEYVNYRFKAKERRFRDYLADPANYRDKTFLMLLKRLNKNPDLLTDPDFIKEVDKFIAMKSIEPADNEFVSFNAWVKAKVEKRKYYDVFLEMVK